VLIPALRFLILAQGIEPADEFVDVFDAPLGAGQAGAVVLEPAGVVHDVDQPAHGGDRLLPRLLAVAADPGGELGQAFARSLAEVLGSG
jgi:hypothetical protein